MMDIVYVLRAFFLGFAILVTAWSFWESRRIDRDVARLEQEDRDR